MLTPQNKKLQFFRQSEAKKASYQPGPLFSFSDFSENWLGEFEIRNYFRRSGEGV